MPLLLVSMLLGGGMSSRLFQRVREELGLAYSVYTFQSFHADAGMHGVYVGDGAGTASAALDAIRERAARMSSRTDFRPTSSRWEAAAQGADYALAGERLVADVSRGVASSCTTSRIARSTSSSR